MVIPADVRDAIVAHARAGLPNEACGILAAVLRATASAAPAETPAKTPSSFSSSRSVCTASAFETSTLRSSWLMSRMGGV